MNRLALSFVAAFALAATAPALADMSSGTMMKMPGQVTIPIMAENGSGETGKALLKQSGKTLTVTITLKGAPATAQPAHIHKGTCATLDPKPAFPLTNVVNGTSVTKLTTVSLTTLLHGQFAVNVHKSPDDIATYVACGDVKMKGSM